MKRVLVAAVASAALLIAGCTPKNLDDTFATVCASVPVADAAFQLYASSKKVKQSVIDTERKAVAAAQAVCNGARPADVNTAIAAVSRAIAAISEATRTARIQAST